MLTVVSFIMHPLPLPVIPS
ncbi:unnamed protein product [Spirodela intermedia]|uniref:Uncharacterized protein n=1 Tax=Spirodela intermedia TaxID=51605 RepID=A0A7I8IU29_SPIIN|nr:unnamed protein product [Spirodela intermedia]CAA6661297.1 unnamed protein product [Spirodela intermedia]